MRTEISTILWDKRFLSDIGLVLIVMSAPQRGECELCLCITIEKTVQILSLTEVEESIDIEVTMSLHLLYFPSILSRIDVGVFIIWREIKEEDEILATVPVNRNPMSILYYLLELILYG